MKHARPDRFAGSRGFTLVESVIVLVLLAIAAVGIISLQSNIFYGQSGNKNIQVGVQLMQECAEQILAIRRAKGYGDLSLAAGTSAACDLMKLTNPTYDHPIVTITVGDSTTIGAPPSPCPSAVALSCKLVSITQAQGGLTPLTLMLVSY